MEGTSASALEADSASCPAACRLGWGSTWAPGSGEARLALGEALSQHEQSRLRHTQWWGARSTPAPQKRDLGWRPVGVACGGWLGWGWGRPREEAHQAPAEGGTC